MIGNLKQNIVNSKKEHKEIGKKVPLPKEIYSVPERLKELREKEGYTQETVADALDIDVRTYQRIEKRYYAPKLEVIAKVSVLYGVSIDYIVLRKEN